MTPSRRRFAVPAAVLSLCAAALAPLAARAEAANQRAQEALDLVGVRVEAGDCKDAVRALNKGLQAGHPELALLAGSMYEDGICVRRDWQRAVHFYVMAQQGGQSKALYRLAAGYAAPGADQDMAAALWWASRERALVPACGVPKEVRNDPDGFVAALAAWPQQKLVHCNYMVGVMAMMGGEMRYPDRAADFALGGNLELRFVPSVPRVDVRTIGTDAYHIGGLLDGGNLQERDSARTAGSFAEMTQKIAQRAFKRFPQPAGIDPALSTTMGMSFTIEHY